MLITAVQCHPRYLPSANSLEVPMSLLSYVSPDRIANIIYQTSLLGDQQLPPPGRLRSQVLESVTEIKHWVGGPTNWVMQQSINRPNVQT